MRISNSSLLLATFAASLPLLLLSTSASAHQVGLSQVDIEMNGPQLHMKVGLAASEIVAAWPTLDLNSDGNLQGAELDPGAFGTALLGVFDAHVDNEGKSACKQQLVSVVPSASDAADAEGDSVGVVVTVVAECAAEDVPGAKIEVGLPWLQQVALGHRSVVNAHAEDGWRTEVVLTRTSPSVVLDRDVRTAAAAKAFFGLGIEHILIGADHLLFLFGLVLLRARKRDLLALVSAFTLAHSITLSAAAMGWFSLSSSFVEPIIALSVAFVGLENFFKPDMSKRWRLTLAFGLIHGFGFAGVLREIGLPQESTGLALFLFNLGVEAGQLIVLAAVLPVLWLCRRHPAFDRVVVPLLSAAVIIVGLFWLIERVV